MRTIKFRIRLRCIKESEMWKIGEEMILINEVFDKQNGVAFWSIDRDIWEITSIEQFTGLLDKNGKEIYEGDIVKWDDDSNGKYWRECQIVWNKSRFELRGHTYNTTTPNEKRDVVFRFGAFIYEHDGQLEIIGNIHSNPELLK